MVKRKEKERELQRRQREAMAEAGLSENFVTSVGEAALRLKHWASLEYLIRSQCLYVQMLPGLFPALIENKKLVC